MLLVTIALPWPPDCAEHGSCSGAFLHTYAKKWSEPGAPGGNPTVVVSRGGMLGRQVQSGGRWARRAGVHGGEQVTAAKLNNTTELRLSAPIVSISTTSKGPSASMGHIMSLVSLQVHDTSFIKPGKLAVGLYELAVGLYELAIGLYELAVGL